MKNHERLRGFVLDFTKLVTETDDETEILERGSELLGDLVADDDWLPEQCAQEVEDRYQQYLIHCDPLERFSVVSFVWGRGQSTPIHDHTVWGLVGMLRGGENSRQFVISECGAPIPVGDGKSLSPGDVEQISSVTGDVHQVTNTSPDGVSISIHVYGANIGTVRRHIFDAQTSEVKSFVSGYSRDDIPNIWDYSDENGNIC